MNVANDPACSHSIRDCTFTSLNRQFIRRLQLRLGYCFLGSCFLGSCFLGSCFLGFCCLWPWRPSRQRIDRPGGSMARAWHTYGTHVAASPMSGVPGDPVASMRHFSTIRGSHPLL